MNRFGAWCGVFYVLIVFAGWWPVAGFFPIHKPAALAADIAPFYQGDVFGIRRGMILIMLSVAFFIPFTATMADYVASIEGRRGTLTNTLLLSGFANAMLTFYPALWWLTAAFRPEHRPDQLVHLLNDVGWLQIVGGLSLIWPMYLVMVIAILSDKSAQPIIPRWMAFFSLWTVVMMLPNQLLFFFKTGPFAWNGLFGFWVPVTMFAAWFLLVAFFLRRADWTQPG